MKLIQYEDYYESRTDSKGCRATFWTLMSLIILMIVISIFTCERTKAQYTSAKYYPTSISVVGLVAPFGFGGRFEYQLPSRHTINYVSWLGTYIQYTQSKVRWDDGSYIKDCGKATIGLTIYNKLSSDSYTTFSAGITNNSYGKKWFNPSSYMDKTDPSDITTSFEIGGGAVIKRNRVGFILDPILWGGGFYYGRRF